MPGRNSGYCPPDITPGAELSRDPEAAPSAEDCGICGGSHPTRTVKGGD